MVIEDKTVLLNRNDLIHYYKELLIKDIEIYHFKSDDENFMFDIVNKSSFIIFIDDNKQTKIFKNKWEGYKNSNFNANLKELENLIK